MTTSYPPPPSSLLLILPLPLLPPFSTPFFTTRSDRLNRDNTILALRKELQTNHDSLVSVQKVSPQTNWFQFSPPKGMTQLCQSLLCNISIQPDMPRGCVSLQEYEAYRKHCTELLAHERKLNQQLRHVLE